MTPGTDTDRKQRCKGNTTSDPPLQGTPDQEKLRRGIRTSRNARWRAATLILVHVLILVHLTQWLVTGTTISPVEPSESMFTFEEGKVNAGFIFFVLAILSCAIFGRFFCGWGCHIVALQDLCAWFMKKIGVRPRTFRSRFLAYYPMFIALYMFAWPTAKRFLSPLVSWLDRPRPFPGFTNHLLTDDFWHTFATWEAIPFLLVCGFAAVYFLGAKGFCKYGCPYGAFFGIADRFAPGQIMANLDACDKCGHCTATCTSNVRVHEEIQIHGKVVASSCFKCLDCVSVCPTQALSFGWGKPELFSRARPGTRRVKKQYDMSLGEELFLAVFAFVSFCAVRGIYNLVPMLMAVGVAACTTFLVWKLGRLFRDGDVRLHRYVLKRQGRLQRPGVVFVAGAIVALLFTVHSGAINLRLRLGDRLDRGVNISEAQALAATPPRLAPEMEARARSALAHYRAGQPLFRGGWGLVATDHLDQIYLPSRIVWLLLVLGERDEAEAELRRVMQATGPGDAYCFYLAELERLRGEEQASFESLVDTLQEHPEFHRVSRGVAERLRIRATALVEKGNSVAAERLYRDVLAKVPGDVHIRSQLAVEVYLSPHVQRLEAGIRELEIARDHGPRNAELHRLLAVALFFNKGDRDTGLKVMAEAVELAPHNALLLTQYAQMLALAGR